MLGRRYGLFLALVMLCLPIGSMVVPFGGAYLGSYTVIPKQKGATLEPMGNLNAEVGKI